MSADTPARVCGWGNTSMVGTSMPAELHCVNTKVSYTISQSLKLSFSLCFKNSLNIL